MKKLITLLVLMSIIVSGFCACSKDEIKSVTVDDTKYETIYLYSFKDAEIDGSFSFVDEKISLTYTGYVYSTEKLNPGDTIKVWNSVLFYESGMGTNAIIDTVEEVYRVKIENKNDSYKITYYDYVGSSCASNKENLKSPDVYKIEVVKERVTIEYET